MLNAVLLVIITLSLFLLIGLSIYTIYRDTTRLDNNFRLQMTAASASRMPDISKYSYEELMKMLNNIIDYYTSQNLDVISLANKSEEEISLIMHDMSVDICTKVVTGLSPTFINCIQAYITEDFFNRYIINSVNMMIVLNIEKRRARNNRKSSQPKQSTKPQKSAVDRQIK